MIKEMLTPKEPEKIVEEFRDRIQKLFGENLYCIAIYGSVASKEYRKGASDINLVVVLKKIDYDLLEKLFENKNRLHIPEVPALLILTENEMRSAVDVFPLEFLDINCNHRCVLGTDIFANITIKKSEVKRQLRFELQSKLIRLRQSYLQMASGNSDVKLATLVAGTVSATSPLLNGLLYLKGGIPRTKKLERIDEISNRYGIDMSPLRDAYLLKSGHKKMTRNEMLKCIRGLFIVISNLSDVVDTVVVE